jgi:hypothetical protein
LLAGFATWDNATFSHIAAWMDNVSFHWYDFLAKLLQSRHQDWWSWFLAGKLYVLLVLLLILSTSLVWRLLNRGAMTDDPVLRVYEHFCHKLQRKGFVRLSYESATGYAARVCGERPDLEQNIQSITRLYNQLRYGKKPCQTAYQQMRREIAQFRP